MLCQHLEAKRSTSRLIWGGQMTIGLQRVEGACVVVFFVCIFKTKPYWTNIYIYIYNFVSMWFGCFWPPSHAISTSSQMFLLQKTKTIKNKQSTNTTISTFVCFCVGSIFSFKIFILTKPCCYAELRIRGFYLLKFAVSVTACDLVGWSLSKPSNRPGLSLETYRLGVAPSQDASDHHRESL